MLSVYIGAVKSKDFDYYKPYLGQDKDTASYTYCPDCIIKSDIATGGDLVCVLKEVMNALKDGEEYLLTAFDDGYELND